jgi:hypothetical protein
LRVESDDREWIEQASRRGRHIDCQCRHGAALVVLDLNLVADDLERIRRIEREAEAREIDLQRLVRIKAIVGEDDGLCVRCRNRGPDRLEADDESRVQYTAGRL